MNKQFKSWSEGEEQQLLKEIGEGLPVYAIAKVHDRSQKAITIRLQDMGIRMLGDGCTYDHIKQKTGMSEQQIKERMEQVRQERNGSKTPNVPFRELPTTDQSLLSTILQELRELKTLLATSNEVSV